MVLLAGIAALLNLWALGRNGWANEYYAAAVRSMSTSWHDFLFASLDHSGVMTVDKPPLALWVEALSVRVFGYHPLSMLVPEALMGVASVLLLYDLVRRVFGRFAGVIAGLALALTPITVAISRHNNPDALLVLCCVAALWFAVRALQDGRTRWLLLAGVAVGLGFETKMGVALTVVPGIALAWLWVAPAGRGRLHALRQLIGAGAVMTLVAGAWPALVELTPAADRPWISGTADNRILSLIFEYNGLGRVDGQAGGPGGAGGNMFGGTPGPLRLLNSALGGQAGWLLGFALVAGLGILVSSRLRPSDSRSGWLIAVGGAFLATAVLFSAASGIFHPYYVSLLAPFAAALTGAGAAQLASRRVSARFLAPAAIAAGVVVELVVRSRYPGQLTWLAPVLIAVGTIAALALILLRSQRARLIAVAGAAGALMLAPSVWAIDTLGHATSGTFPAGGPASAESFGGGGAGGIPSFIRRAGAGAGAGAPSGGGAPALFGGAAGAAAGPTGTEAAPQSAQGLFGAAGASAGVGAARSGGGAAGAGLGGVPGPSGAGGGGGFGNDAALKEVLGYVQRHGGGTVAVSSQSSAAGAIISDGADVAGIGGFSGQESDVSVSWLADEVRAGKIRWVLTESGGLGSGSAGGGPGLGGAGSGFSGAGAGLAGGGSGSAGAGAAPRSFGGAAGAAPGAGGSGGRPGGSRPGSKKAMAAVERACLKVSVPGQSSSAGATLYDCAGRAGALAALDEREASL